MNLVIAADEPEIEDATSEFRSLGVTVDAVQCDLAEVWME
jgi:hypothetical protein